VADSIIVVFDGVPKTEAQADSLILTAEYVTVYDWTVTWLSGLIEEPRYRLIVFDITSGRLFASKLFAGLTGTFSWVRTECAKTGFKIFAALCDDATSPRRADPDWRAAQEGLRDLWTSRLTRAGKRHEVSNLLAPFVLAYDLKARDWPGASDVVARLECDLLRRALVTEVEAFGILQATKGRTTRLPRQTEFRIEQLAEADPFGRFARQVKFMLVDDQFNLGYREIVQCLLFGDPAVSQRGSFELVCTAKPDELVEWLESHIGQREPRLIGKDCILLLDLRLFASRPNGEAEEKRFLERLLRLYDSCDLRSGSLESAASAARAHVAAADGNQGLAYLVFLPLLLSHADPSLPIVLFTSSHQRAIWKAVEDRPNIITGFAKPIVSGYAPGGPAGDAIDDLIESITEGLWLHKIRVVWEALVDFAHRIPFQASEPGLLNLEGDEISYNIDLDAVRILANQFETVLASRRNADALLTPDNVLERAGAKVKYPGELSDIELIWFAEERGKQKKDWHTFLDESLSDPVLSSAAIGLCGRLIPEMKKDPTDASSNRTNEAINKMMRYFREAGNAVSGWLHAFEVQYPQSATVLKHEFKVGSLEKFLHLAFSNAEQNVPNRLGETAKKLAAYEFYSVLAAMRNARAHFRVGSNQHGGIERTGECPTAPETSQLEVYAIWTWLWFLLGCGRQPPAMTPGPAANRDSLLLAKRQGWLPKSALMDAPGEEFCRRIITGLGHLVRLGILEPSQDVLVPVTYAVNLASAEDIAVQADVAASTSLGVERRPEPLRPAAVGDFAPAGSGNQPGAHPLPDGSLAREEATVVQAAGAAPSCTDAVRLVEPTEAGPPPPKVEASRQLAPDATKKPPSAPALPKVRREDKPRRWPAGATYRPFADQLQKFCDPKD
jgi:hypothetical protein